MLKLNNVGEQGLNIPNTHFNRPIIFIPKWLDKRVRDYSKNETVLKNIDGLFSILIPADVSFYLEQVAAISKHPSVKPYMASFDVFSHADRDSWGSNISNFKAAKRYNDLMGILARGSDASNKETYSPDSYVENNTHRGGYAGAPMIEATDMDLPYSREDIAAILGINVSDNVTDLNNLRVVVDELDADVLVLRVEPLDPDQSVMSQITAQTEVNIRKITQYYEIKQVMASPVGKYYTRLVLSSSNS